MSKQTKQTKRAHLNIEVVGNTIKINDPAMSYRYEKYAQQRGMTPQDACRELVEQYLANR